MRGGLVIWLHGLGDSGMGWSFLGSQLRFPKEIAYSYPDAPNQPVSCNGGMGMPSWMDLVQIPVMPGLADDKPGLEASSKRIHELIDAEVAKGTPSERIVLGGFSQGGALAMRAGFAYPRRLAGVASLSGWATEVDDLASRVSGGANSGTPLFVGHGTADQVVLPECAPDAVERHKAAGVDVTSVQYAAQHDCPPAGFQALRAWLKQALEVEE